MIGTETPSAAPAPALAAPSCRILHGDALTELSGLPRDSVHCGVTSPPYWALRDYEGPSLDFDAGRYAPMPGVPPVEYSAWHGQLGLEPDPIMFIGHLVEIFRELRRVLRDDGTCWVNMGDSYSANAGSSNRGAFRPATNGRGESQKNFKPVEMPKLPRSRFLAEKNMIGQPWRLAFALQADGWYLRQDIIWHKPNPMPESTRDRCTKAHEYLFLLTKSPRYFFDAAAISEPVSGGAKPRGKGVHAKVLKVPAGWAVGAADHSAIGHNLVSRSPKAFGANSRVNRDRDPAHQTEAKIRAKQNRSYSAAVKGLVDRRNKRDVWSISPKGYKGAHFATFPPALVEPCILAGCPKGGVVLDIFGGSGTTAAVALKHGRNALLVELNPDYIPLIDERLAKASA